MSAHREPHETVAIFLPNFKGGGAERVMVDIANGLSRSSVQVDLVVVSAEGQYRDQVDDGVDIIDLHRARTLRAVVPLANYLRAKKPRSLLTAMHHANLAGILASKLARFPGKLVVSVHNAVGKQSGSSGLRRSVWNLLGRLYNGATTVVAVSKGVGDDAMERYRLPPGKIRVVPNPVDLAQIDGLAFEAVDHPWFVDHDVPIVVAVGRLQPVKDFETLLRAFAKLRAKVPARLVILGEGPMLDDLTDLARTLGLEGSVAFPGFQANPFSWMREADLFAMSSQSEGLPTALVQAMGCGTQVVSTDCKHGPAEILESGEWGVLVPVGDADALADGMRRALTGPTTFNVRQRAEQFSLPQALRAYSDVLGIRTDASKEQGPDANAGS